MQTTRTYTRIPISIDIQNYNSQYRFHHFFRQCCFAFRRGFDGTGSGSVSTITSNTDLIFRLSLECVCTPVPSCSSYGLHF